MFKKLMTWHFSVQSLRENMKFRFREIRADRDTKGTNGDSSTVVVKTVRTENYRATEREEERKRRIKKPRR